MKNKVMVSGILIVAGLLALGALPTVQAFHGTWWRGFGTASVGGIAIPLDFVWGGQDQVINCGGGGCQGTGDGWYHYLGNELALPLTYVQATEDVRNILFTATPTCGTLEVTPNYSLVAVGKLDIRGRQENCLDNFPLSNNNNRLTGTLDVFSVNIVANGGFRAGAPPVGAADNWCCHG